MSIDADILRRLAALDLPKEAFQEVLSIVADMAAKNEAKRKAAQNRTAKWREGQKHNGDATVTLSVTSPERHGDCHDPLLSSSLPGEPLTDSAQERKEGALVSAPARSENPANWPADAWEQFYGPYPNKVGKKPARRAFERIQRGGKVPWLVLYGGLQRYLAKTDDRAWCNPATWLNEERWEDQPAPNGGPNGQFARAGAPGGSHKSPGGSFLTGMAAVLATRPDSRLYRGDEGGRDQGANGRADDRAEPLTLDLGPGSYRETGG